ncbi:MAG: hypothetical protein ACJ75S_09955 [Solirubrobacterales bacterium]
MESMTSSWTDDRMDDLKHQVGELGRRTDEGFLAIRSEMDHRFDGMERRFDAMDRRFESMDRRFESMNARFDATQRAILVLAASMFSAMLGLIATQL